MEGILCALSFVVGIGVGVLCRRVFVRRRRPAVPLSEAEERQVRAEAQKIHRFLHFDGFDTPKIDE